MSLTEDGTINSALTDQQAISGQVLDAASLLAEVEQEIGNLPPDQTFSISELTKRTGETGANLLYLEQNYSLLKPFTEKKGKRDVRRYSISDLRNALLVAKLKQRGYTPKQIGPLLQAWQEASATILPSTVAPVIHASMDFVDRVKVQVLARLLQIVAQKICQDELLRDALIIVRQVPFDGTQSSTMPFRVFRQTKSDVIPLIRMYNQIPIGWSTLDGEVFIRFQAIDDLIRRVDSWEFYGIQVEDPAKQYTYTVTLGLAQDNADPQLLAIKYWLGQTHLPLSESDRSFLCGLMGIMYSVILKIREIIRSKDSPIYRLISQGDMLSVLADAIVAISPNKWDYCGILLPFGGDSSTLQVAAASAAFPQPLRSRALYQVEQSLPGWVYKTGEILFINSIVDKDPRILFQELERPTAIAILPAPGIVKEKPKGILYVGSRHVQGHQEVFTEDDLRILGVFGEIAGEIIGRQHLNESIVSGALELAKIPPVCIGSLADLRGSLKSVLQNIRDTSQAGKGLDSNLLILAIRISNFEQIAERDPEVANWLVNKIQEKVGRFLQSKKANVPGIDLNVYNIDNDRIVALVPRVGPNVKQIREELGGELNRMKNLGMSITIGIHVWSLAFSYRDLIQQFNLNLDQGEEKTIEQSIEILLGRTNGALKVLSYIQEGDQALREQEFDKARFKYELACDLDPENPYHFRHLAECLIGMGRYKEAMTAAQKAVDLDPSYPGSYHRLAEAYIGLGDKAKGYNLYEEAIRLKPNDPTTHKRYGQALLLYGDHSDIKRAIEQFKEAMNYDQPQTDFQILYLHYVARALARFGDYETAIDWYRQALALAPNDESLWFELQQNRYELAKSKRPLLDDGKKLST